MPRVERVGRSQRAERRIRFIEIPFRVAFVAAMMNRGDSTALTACQSRMLITARRVSGERNVQHWVAATRHLHPGPRGASVFSETLTHRSLRRR